jgi:hypothetical protein
MTTVIHSFSYGAFSAVIFSLELKEQEVGRGNNLQYQMVQPLTKCGMSVPSTRRNPQKDFGWGLQNGRTTLSEL